MGFGINGKVSEGLNAGKDAVNNKAGKEVVTDEHVEKAESIINDKPSGFGK
ncbi:ribosome recycling factor [Rothia sp. ZJ932]|nr:ribosome recycling factor [Rothia sp. ZJ1223]QRZ62484.1 ribosome recycling factor [Rothia sp. ZJ932]